MKIVSYQTEDYPGVLALLKEEDWRPFFDTFKNEYKKALDSSHTFVAKEDGEVIGFLRAISDGLYLTFIGELIVKKEHRRKSIGTALINHLQSKVKTVKMELISDVDVFYENNHFKAVGTGQRKQNS